MIINEAIKFIADNIGSDYLALSELFKTIFDISREYYKYNNQDENDQKLVLYLLILLARVLVLSKFCKIGMV